VLTNFVFLYYSAVIWRELGLNLLHSINKERYIKINRGHQASFIVLAGDTNQLKNEDVNEKTGLIQIVHQPTRGKNILDRVYVSNPLSYDKIRVVTSVVKSDHKVRRMHR